LQELKAPIEVHFVNGVPHPTTLQVKDVPIQLKNWRGKVDLLVSTLRGMDCILGMEFITRNNVFIKRHNRLVRIPSKNFLSHKFLGPYASPFKMLEKKFSTLTN
jgi:hypothetical protein